MTKMNKSFKEIEGAEYGVDSRYTSKKERQADSKALMEARLDRMKNVSSDQIIRAKLLQLKLKMEEYIQKPVYKNHNFFTEFLTSYNRIPQDTKQLDEKMFAKIGYALCYMNYFYPEIFKDSNQKKRVKKLIKKFCNERKDHFNDEFWLQEQIYIFEDEIENMC